MMSAAQDVQALTLPQLLEVQVQSRYNEPFIVCGEEFLTYQEYNRISTYFADILRDRYKIIAGSSVAIVADNSPVYLVAIMAIWKLSATSVPIAFTAPVNLIFDMIKASKASHCIVSVDLHQLLMDQLASRRNDMNSPVEIFTFSDLLLSTKPNLSEEQLPKSNDFSGISRDPSLTSLKYLAINTEVTDFGLSSSCAMPNLDMNENNIAACLFTSSAINASTLKCVPLSHKTLLHNCRARNRRLGITTPEKSFGWLPLFHVMGLVVDFLNGALFTGGQYIFGGLNHEIEYSENKQHKAMTLSDIILANIEKHKPTLTSTVPWLFEDWKLKAPLGSPEKKRLDRILQTFKTIIIGGAPVTDDLLHWCHEGGIALNNAIGMTEVGGTLFQNSVLAPNRDGRLIFNQKHDHTFLDPLPGFEIVFMPVEDDGDESNEENQNPTLEKGELLVESDYLPHGYINLSPSQNSKHLTINPQTKKVQFRTGDIYQRNSRSQYKYLCRADDIIQFSTGEKMNASAFETALGRHPAICRSCVMGNNPLSDSDSIYPIIVIEPDYPYISSTEGEGEKIVESEVWQAISQTNSVFAPHCRVSRDSAIILAQGEKIPLTRKRMVHRKILRQEFGSRIEGLVRMKETRNATIANSEQPEADLPQAMTSSIEDELSANVDQAIQTLARELLHILDTDEAESDGFDMNTNFSEYGINSMISTTFVNRLNRIFHLKLPLNLLYMKTNGQVLADHISELLSGKLKILIPPQIPFIPEAKKSEDTLVAVVGMAVRLPGEVDSLQKYWEVLQSGSDIIKRVPKSRWSLDDLYDPDPDTLGKMHVTKGGWIENVDQFDPAFFQLSPTESYLLRPNVRLSLECSWEALENAGIPPSLLKETNTSVFIGSGTEDGFDKLVLTNHGIQGFNRTGGAGMSNSAVTGRLSYFYGIHGPSVTLETACSASSVALHQGVQSILSGESNVSIVGGVTTHVFPHSFVFLSTARMASASGRCATFDKEADGYAPSEGCVIMVLKSLKQAIQDGDRIEAVIKASSVQQDGKSQGLTAPNPMAQVDLMRTTLAKAQLTPKDITFVEAHGTGTPLGDPIEMQALNEVFAGSHDDNNKLWVSSVKTVFGHTEEAAGLVGLSKAILSLQKGILSPHLNLTELNSSIDLSLTPIAIPTQSTILSGNEVPKKAMVNSFGFTGTISSIILEEYKPDTSAFAGILHDSERAHILTLSAKTQQSLLALLKRYADYLRASEESIGDIAYTSNIGREHFKHRLAFVGKTVGSLLTSIDNSLKKEQKLPIKDLNVAAKKVAFLFTGQGSQYEDMGRDLFETQPVFRETMKECDTIFMEVMGISLLEIMYPDLAESKPSNDSTNKKKYSIDATIISQPALLMFQYSMTQLWKSWGINPSIVIGHSLGEIIAATVAGAIDLRTALEFVCIRGTLMQPNENPPGSMVSVFTTEDILHETIISMDKLDKVNIGALNGRTHCVLSGVKTDVEDVLSTLSERGIKFSRLAVNQGFHSPAIEFSLGPLREWILKNSSGFNSVKIPFVSNVTAKIIHPGTRLNEDYWISHARSTVQFHRGIEQVLDSGCLAFLEVGPSPTLVSMIKRVLGDRHTIANEIHLKMPDPVLIWSCKKNTNDEQTIFDSVSSLYRMGLSIDWNKFHQRTASSLLSASNKLPLKKILLPTYAFQYKRFWPDPHGKPDFGPKRLVAAEQPLTTKGEENSDKLGHPFVGGPFYSIHQSKWFFSKTIDLSKNNSLLHDYKFAETMVLPTAAFIDMILSACKMIQTDATLPLTIANIYFLLPLTLNKNDVFTLEIVISDQEPRAFEIHSRVSKLKSKLHANGQLGNSLNNNNAYNFMSEIDAIKKQAQHITNMDALYQSIPYLSIASTFKVVRNLWVTSECILSEISLNKSRDLQNVESHFTMHPCLLQSAFLLQNIAPLSPQEIFMSHSIHNFVLYDSLPKEIMVKYSRQRSTSESNTQTATIHFYDTIKGNIVAMVEIYKAKQVPLKSVIKSIAPDRVPLLYRTTWIETNLEYQLNSFGFPVKLVIFADKLGFGETLARRAKERFGIRSTLVRRNGDPNTQPIKGTLKVEIDPNELEDYRDVLHFKGEEYLLIVHAWGLDSTLDKLFDGCGTALNVMKTTLTEKSHYKRINTFFLTQGAAAITADDLLESTESITSSLVADSFKVHQACLLGAVKTFRLECPKEINGIAIDMDTSSAPGNEKTADNTLDDMLRAVNNETHSPIVYRKHKRFIPKLELVSSQYHLSQESFFSGTYLLTGGFGGVTKDISKWLVSEKKVKSLVLVGRTSNGDTAHSEHIQELKTLGAENVVYFAGDVSCYDDLDRVFKTVFEHSDLPPIKGVIHAAGVIHDALIGNQVWENFENVFTPKVHGSWNLHQLTKSMDLDHFILLSSIASTVGNIGQINYTAANSFLDTFASWRRSQNLPAISIQLGVWESSGMAAKLQGLKGPLSVYPMNSALALDSLSQALLQPQAVQAIADIDFTQLVKRSPLFDPFYTSFVPNDISRPATVSSTKFSSPTPPRKNKTDSIQNVEKTLLNLLSTLLGLDEDFEFDNEETLTTYGVDSLTFTELCALVEKKYNCELPKELFSDINNNIQSVTQWIYEHQTVLSIHEEALGHSIDGEETICVTTSASSSAIKNRKTPEIVTAKFVSILLDLLQLDEEFEIDLEESLVAYGVDSLSFAELSGLVEEEFAYEIPKSMFSESEKSIADVISLIVGHLKQYENRS